MRDLWNLLTTFKTFNETYDRSRFDFIHKMVYYMFGWDEMNLLTKNSFRFYWPLTVIEMN